MKTKIYILCEPDGEIRYIGKTYKKLSRRLSQHLTLARSGKKNHRLDWIRSVLSKGYLPKIELIGEVDGSGSSEEVAWIAYGKQEGWRLVNETEGGEGVIGRSADALEKMRAANIGRKISDYQKKRISEANRVRIVSEETRKKSSLANRGQTRSIETCLRISKAQKSSQAVIDHCRRTALAHRGVKLSIEHRKNISDGGKALNRTVSPEARAKMSLARKKYWQSRK